MAGCSERPVKLTVKGGLPYVTASVTYRGRRIAIENVLIDTGSGGTVFLTDRLLEVGLKMEPQDVVRRLRGVGGSEFVFTKQVDAVCLGDLEMFDFEIEVGALDYGFEIEGILGMDFLVGVGAVIDLAQMQVTS